MFASRFLQGYNVILMKQIVCLFLADLIKPLIDKVKLDVLQFLNRFFLLKYTGNVFSFA